ncbi:MAG TPA: hypothetical protein QGF58_13305 [Myxococcota bacterium]|nr:hypothetical protein [Myxococcota bacterium]
MFAFITFLCTVTAGFVAGMLGAAAMRPARRKQPPARRRAPAPARPDLAATIIVRPSFDPDAPTVCMDPEELTAAWISQPSPGAR